MAATRGRFGLLLVLLLLPCLAVGMLERGLIQGENALELSGTVTEHDDIDFSVVVSSTTAPPAPDPLGAVEARFRWAAAFPLGLASLLHAGLSLRSDVAPASPRSPPFT